MTDGSGVNVVTLQGAVAGDRPAVSLVHGFTQNAACWSPLDEALADLGTVVAVDLPGHGSSAAPSGDLVTAGRAVAHAAAADLVVGYSLGGRLLLHGLLTGDAPAIKGLVLIGAHPGIVEQSVRDARLAEDLGRADRLEQIGLPAFLDEWLRLPLFNGVDPDRAHLQSRLTNDATGVAAALRAFSTGHQEPLWDRLATLSVPTLVLAGSLDSRYTDIGRRTAEAIGDNAQLVTIPDAGHACHLEDPWSTAAAIHAWLSEGPSLTR